MKLNESQKKAIPWLFNKKNAFLILPPGRGKSLTFYSVFYLRKQRGLSKRALVFTHVKGIPAYPKNNYYNLSLVVIATTEDFEKYIAQNPDYWVEKADVVVVTTSLLNRPKNIAFMRSIMKYFDYLGLDECHRYRNLNSSGTSQAIAILSMAFNGVRLGITATPFYTKMENVWSLCHLIIPWLFPSQEAFNARYMSYQDVVIDQETVVNGIPTTVPRVTKQFVGYKNVEEVYEILKPYIYAEYSQEGRFNIGYQITKVAFNEDERLDYRKIRAGLDLLNSVKLSLVPCLFVDGKYESGLPLSKVTSKNSLVSAYAGASGIIKCPVTRIAPGNMIYIPTTPSNVKRSGVDSKELSNFLVEGLLPVKVTEVSQKLNENDYVQRMGPMIKFCSQSNSKLEALKKELDALGAKDGMLIYVTYYETLEFLVSHLGKRYVCADGSAKPVVTITGSDSHKNAMKKVNMLSGTEITIITAAATESLDFYFNHALIYEPLGQPGKVVQFFGRITRENSAHTSVKIIFLINEDSIDLYFYERLRYYIKATPYDSLKTNLTTLLTPAQEKLFDSKKRGHLGMLKKLFLWDKYADRKGLS